MRRRRFFVGDADVGIFIVVLPRKACAVVLHQNGAPLPGLYGPDTREMLWRTTIPKTTPLDEDVDIRFLAEKYEFAGGNIKNCILNAAFLAAADETANGKVCMRHYLNAIKYEFVKVGKVFTRSDFEPYAEEVGL